VERRGKRKGRVGGKGGGRGREGEGEGNLLGKGKGRKRRGRWVREATVSEGDTTGREGKDSRRKHKQEGERPRRRRGEWEAADSTQYSRQYTVYIHTSLYVYRHA
jgi:hypothetical protein